MTETKTTDKATNTLIKIVMACILCFLAGQYWHVWTKDEKPKSSSQKLLDDKEESDGKAFSWGGALLLAALILAFVFEWIEQHVLLSLALALAIVILVAFVIEYLRNLLKQ